MTLPSLRTHPLVSPASLTLVQVIRTRWTKKSRGAPAASIRNDVAESAWLPLDHPLPQAGMLWHEVVFDEAHAFEPHEVIRRYPVGMRNLHAAEIIPQQHGLRIQWQGTQHIELPVGSWGRLVFNHRTDEVTDGWLHRVYHKICINAVMGAVPRNNLFQGTDCSRELRCLRPLW